jgi:hypothetical protein
MAFPSISLARDEAILGPVNVHGPDEAERHCWLRYTLPQRAVLATIPFHEDTLKACAGTHILVARAPITLLRLIELHEGMFYLLPTNLERFALHQYVDVGWFLLRKRPLPGSLGKPYAKQVTLLPDQEEVARLVDLAYGAVMHYVVSCERLFASPQWHGEYFTVRCQEVIEDVNTGEERMALVFADKWFVDEYSDAERADGLGLASCRKAP